jgi:phosphoserine phosphatase
MLSVATIICEKLTSDKLNQIIENLEHNGILTESVKELSKNFAYDVFINSYKPDEARELLNQMQDEIQFDFIVQGREGRQKKLLISDMDSTIINQECLDEIADELGIKPKIAAITERAMNGELDFKSALRERVALLKGLPASKLEGVYKNKITYTEGAKELVQTMKKNGAYCVLVSGGFTFFTEKVRDNCGFDVEEANILEVDSENNLTGKVKEPILDATSKLNSLNYYAQELRITADETLALGDGANDLPMIQNSGLGIAFHAKPFVQKQAKHKINMRNLRAVLYAQGYSDAEIVC